jgi:hypothetical protein
MILKLRIENMKDATGEKKRVMMATLNTDIIGMESINAVSELDEKCLLGREITKLITDMLALKQEALKVEHKKYKKNEKRNVLSKNG